MTGKNDLRACAERLAREATEERFKCRLATEEQRNGYEIGWAEGYVASRSSRWEDERAALVEALGKAVDWFEDYAAQHYAKALTAPDGREQHGREIKGKVNADRAKELRAVLAKSLPSIGEPQ